MKLICALRASAAVCLINAYQPEGAGWKMDGDKIAVDGDGNPVYINADGDELSVRGDTITRLGNEAKQHRERAQAAENKLRGYEGIDDPEAARKALETVSKLTNKELIEAGKVDEVKAEITRVYEGQVAERDKKIGDLTDRLRNNALEAAFRGSDFIRDNLNVPVDFVQAAFKDRFRVEDDGRLIPIDKNGNALLSKKRAGEDADFEEALTMFVESHPQRDMLLKAPDARGTGNNGGGGTRGGGNIIKRSDFDQMEPHVQADYAAKAGRGEVKIVD